MSEDLLVVRKLITDLFDLAEVKAETAQDWTDDHELFREKNALYQYA
jgi:hypothetical protein